MAPRSEISYVSERMFHATCSAELQGMPHWTNLLPEIIRVIDRGTFGESGWLFKHGRTRAR